MFVAAIGKHPGWNDHVEDLGLDTEALAELRQVLYLDGVGGNVDHGTWDELEPDQRIEGFDHEFVWKRGSVAIVGRMWSSRDGKGRSKYPMIVCAQAPAGNERWLLDEAMASLDRLAETCRATEEAERVREEVARTRAELRRAWGEPAAEAGAGTEAIGARTAAGELAEASELGPDRRGMHRLLYQIDRDMRAFVNGGAGSRGDGGRGQHVRVPRVMDSPRASLSAWLRFAGERFAPSASVMLVAPSEGRWVDLLVGQPDTARLACLRAGTGHTPMVTEIPYTIDEAFAAEADAWIDRDPGEPEPARKQTQRQEAGSGRPGRGGLALSGRAVAIAAIGGVLVLLLLLGALLLLMSLNGQEQTDAEPERTAGSGAGSRETGGSAGSDAASSNAGFGTVEHEAWARWCRAHEAWYADLAGGLDPELARADPHLRGTLLPLLDRHRGRLDPRDATASAVIDLAAVAANPPADVRNAEGVAAISRADAVLSSIRETLAAEAWPARRRVRERATQFERWGWQALAAHLREAEGRIAFDGEGSLAAGIHRLIEAEAHSAPLVEAIRRAAEAGAALARIGVGPLESASAAVERLHEAGRSASATEALELAPRARTVADILERAVAFMEETWPMLDQPAALAAFEPPDQGGAGASDSGEADPGGAPALARIEAWLRHASRDRWRLLDPETDPRRGLDTLARTSGLGERLAALEEPGAGSEGGERLSLVERVESLAEDARALEGLSWREGQREHVVDETTRVRRELEALAAGIERLEREARTTFEEYAAALRAERSISESGSAAIDEAWRQRRDALLEAHAEARAWGDLHERVESVRAALHAIERRVARPEAAEALEALPDRESVGALLESRRERALREAIEAASREDGSLVDADAVADRVGEIASRHAARNAEDRERVRALADVVERIGAGEVLAGSGTGGPLARWRAWRDKPAMRDFIEASPRLRARIEAIRGVANAETVGELARRTGTAEGEGEAEGAAGMAPVVALAAWRRAVELDGAGSTDSGAAEHLEVMEALLRAARGAAEPLGRPEIEREVRTEAREVWARAARTAGSRAALERAAGRRGAFGGELGMLGPDRRALVVLAGLGRALAALEPSDEAGARAAARSALERLGEVRGEVSGTLAETIERLGQMAGEAEDEASADFGALGPGKAGWTARVFDGGRRVTYTAPGDGGTVLSFVRVEPSAGHGLDRAAYLGGEEVSIAALVAIVEAEGSWEGLEPAWSELRSARAGDGMRPGPSGWRWDEETGRLGVAPSWLGSDAGAYPEGHEPEPPAGSSPMQRISVRAAGRVASWVGCELPTPGLWRAGAAAAGDAGEANLRDAAWLRQLEHVRGGASGPMRWPDAGIFRPLLGGGGMERTARGSEAEAAVARDDGWLWFAPVDAGVEAGGKTGFRHLVGNVAEYVVLEGGGDDRFGVMGASALSPGGYESGRALEVGAFAMGQGYSDVGFRLSFRSEGPAPVGARMAEVLEAIAWAR